MKRYILFVLALSFMQITFAQKQKQKVSKNNNFFNGFPEAIDGELAMLVSNDLKGTGNTYLNQIEIPIVNKTYQLGKEHLMKKQMPKKHPFSVKFEVSFYENDNGKPGERLDYESVLLLIDEKYNVVKVNLSRHNIKVPKEGLFVVLQNLGEINEKQELLEKSPVVYVDTPDGVKTVAQHIKPYFAVDYKLNEQHTFRRFQHYENKDWQAFNNFYSKNEADYHNIGLGYELVQK